MVRLEEGMILPNFVYDTVNEESIAIEDTLKKVKGRTALVFLRYYGCPICQLDIRDYAHHVPAAQEKDGQIILVLQSDRTKLQEKVNREDLPIDIICDPKMELYHEFEIKAAKNKMGLADAKVVAKLMQAKKEGIAHGDYEGEELQLPAVFVMDRNGKITYAHYGKSAGDIPDGEEILKLLSF